MKSVIKQSNGSLRRSKLANPFSHIPMSERLKKRKSIDLRDSHVVIEDNDGFVKVKPIDTTKTF
ncbi:hypothetical protein [Paenibacillus sp. FSL H3-0457]|uniref:hypothetical protein n=1 Tax=Paenibacillus sp. FSL H3-0457 TaxID=2921430 RepID=UPI0030ED96B2